MRARHTAALLCLLLPLATVADGQTVELEERRIYAGGTRLEAPDLGVAFTVPDGWTGTWPADTERIVFQPASDPEVGIVTRAEQASYSDLAATLAQPIPLTGGMVLHPTEAVSSRGEALVCRYRVAGSPTPMIAYGEALPGDHGVAITYVLIGPPESVTRHEAVLRALVDGTELRAPAAAGPDAESPAAEDET